MARILLIDDDEQLGPPLAAYFRRFELVLEQATRPSEGLARLREGNRRAFVDRLNAPADAQPTEQLRSLRQPTLILWGQEDRLIPVAYAHRFASDLPDNQVHLLARSGHVPMEESPAESLLPLRAFLEK